jgi:plastocyanin
MHRALTASIVTLAMAPAAHAATVSPPPPEHRADPALTTYVQRLGPYTIGAYETLRKAATAVAPELPGSIVGMDARLVDAGGAVIGQQIAMLHHLVFTNGGPDDSRHDPACPLKTTRERFWGTSEELRPLTLPPGYGYPTGPADRWRALLMVMHHRAGERTFFLEYRVTVDQRPLLAVKPYWLSVIPCSPDPQWSVPGGRKGTHRRSRTFRMPEAGRIVAVGGHLHGGAEGIALSQPRCGNRTLVRSLPAYAPAGDPLYEIRPLLHEPDPKSISWWQSATGWPIRRGEQLKVTASYDGSRPHTRVMGIDHVYLAPAAVDAPSGCAPARVDAQTLGAEFAGPRSAPPKVRLTLARLGKDGRARASTRGLGAARVARGDVRVLVDDFSFGPDHLSVGLGAIVRWRFDQAVKHDVTLAAGPRGFGSPWLSDGATYRRRFTEPGTYLLHCSLHPAYMSQVVHVRAQRSRPPRRAADPPRR